MRERSHTHVGEIVNNLVITPTSYIECHSHVSPSQCSSHSYSIETATDVSNKNPPGPQRLSSGELLSFSNVDVSKELNEYYTLCISQCQYFTSELGIDVTSCTSKSTIDINSTTLETSSLDDEFWNYFKIISSPADGHCQIHSISRCLSHLNTSLYSDIYEYLLYMIQLECTMNSALYTPFMKKCSKTLLFDEISKYVYLKVFNTDVGDIVFNMISNILGIDIVIIERYNNSHRTFSVSPMQSYKCEQYGVKCVILFKRNLHYDACVPKFNSSCIGTMNESISIFNSSCIEPIYESISIFNSPCIESMIESIPEHEYNSEGLSCVDSLAYSSNVLFNETVNKSLRIQSTDKLDSNLIATSSFSPEELASHSNAFRARREKTSDISTSSGSVNKHYDDEVPPELNNEGTITEDESSNIDSSNRDTDDLSKIRKFRSKYPKNMLIGHYNINSIRNIFFEMRHIFDLCSLDIVGISETKIDDSFPLSQFCIENYKLYRQDRNSRGGGIMMYVKDTIPHRVLKEHSGEKYSIDFITLEVTTQRGKWNLTYIYCPPSVDDKHVTDFMNYLCEHFISKHILSLFFGDINQNLLKDCSLSCICDIHGLTNLIKEPTCFKAETPTLLDVFLTDKPYSFTACLNIDIGLSDFHNFICVTTKLYTPCESKRKIKYRSMKHFCNESFNRDLDNAPFHVCCIFDDIDDVFWAHKSMYESVLNDHAPVKSKTVSNKQVPHMNSKLRKARHQRNMWRNKHFQCRSNKIFRSKYVYWRNKVVSLNRCSIKKYFDEKCNESNCSKSFFKTISPYITDTNLKNGRMIILRENDSIISQPADVAHIFNIYYMSLSEYEETPDSLCDLTLDEIISKHSSHPSVMLINHHTAITQTFNFDFINEDMMLKYIKKLTPNKAPGYDGIQSKILKLSGVSIVAPLSTIFNECVSNCCFPSDMKLSEISPIFKKDDSLTKENYRSVNILTIISKVFERILSDQLTIFF